MLAIVNWYAAAGRVLAQRDGGDLGRSAGEVAGTDPAAGRTVSGECAIGWSAGRGRATARAAP